MNSIISQSSIPTKQSMKKNVLLLILLILGNIPVGRTQDMWNQKSDFGGTSRANAIGFSIGQKGYLGTGGDKAFWEYDPSTDTWTQKANFGGGANRTNAVGFSIGNFGYVGTGLGGFSSELQNDFWQYDQVANTWNQKADFPGVPRQWAVGFSIGDKGYLGTGYTSSSFKKDFWEYEPAMDTWTEKAEFKGKPRSMATGFSIGDKGYIGTGIADNIYGITNDLWEYDPVTDGWFKKAALPGTARAGAVSFSISERGYILTGRDTLFNSLNDMWEYNPIADEWIQKADFSGNERHDAVGFTIGNKGYIGTGRTYDSTCTCSFLLNDFWAYNPDCATPSGLTTTNIKATTARVSWNVVSGAQTYTVRYRKTGTMQWSKTSALSNFKKLTGLMPNTQYDWGVKSVCDAVNNISSDWSATQNFNTKPLRLEDEREEEISLEVFPNPIATSATISFSTVESSDIIIELLDVAGRKSRLLDASVEAGHHELSLDRAGFSDGIYFVRLTMNEQTTMIKVAIE